MHHTDERGNITPTPTETLPTPSPAHYPHSILSIALLRPNAPHRRGGNVAPTPTEALSIPSPAHYPKNNQKT